MVQRFAVDQVDSFDVGGCNPVPNGGNHVRLDILLINIQQRFITEATKRGYYDIPCDCTLTELGLRWMSVRGSKSHSPPR